MTKAAQEIKYEINVDPDAKEREGSISDGFRSGRVDSIRNVISLITLTHISQSFSSLDTLKSRNLLRDDRIDSGSLA